MRSIKEQIGLYGIIPVVTIKNAEDSIPIVEALETGGLPLIEVTLRSSGAIAAMERIAAERPDFLLGAGTVDSEEQAESAHNAGAKFLVSPGLNRAVAEYCQDKELPYFPGVITPTEISAAISLGLTTLKLFPAEAAGGMAWLKAVSAPFPDVSFIPTGGINLGNMNDYLRHHAVHACGGSWLTSKQDIASRNKDHIRELCREAVREMLGFSLHHVGTHLPDSRSVARVAERFSDLFKGSLVTGRNSIMVDGKLEIMSENAHSEVGHIAIGTHSLPRAIHYLERHGVNALEGSEIRSEAGDLIAVYLDVKAGGLAVHLVQK